MELVDGHYVAPLRDGRKATLTLDPELQKPPRSCSMNRVRRVARSSRSPDGRILAFAGRRTDEPKGGKTGTFDFPPSSTDVWAPAASDVQARHRERACSATATIPTRQGLLPRRRSFGDGSNLVDHKSDSNCETSATASRTRTTRSSASSPSEPRADEARSPSARPRLDEKQQLGVKRACGGSHSAGEQRSRVRKSGRRLQGSRLSVLGGAMLAPTFASGGDSHAAHHRFDRRQALRPGKPQRVLDEKVAEAVAR